MTQWTQEQYQELSEKVARKFKLESYLMGVIYGYGENYDGWLYESWPDIMELCVKYGVEAHHLLQHVSCSIHTSRGKLFPQSAHTFHSDHNNDKSLSERVARLLALLEVEL